MKRLLVAAFACLLGFGSAWADVEGNNTAVVIRKAPVVSKTGYQFLCVPVRGFDITGRGQVEGLPLNDVIPPTTKGFIAGTTKLLVEGNIEVDGYVGDGAYTLVADENGSLHWGTQSGGATTDVGTGMVAHAACLWLNVSGPLTDQAQQDALQNALQAALAKKGLALAPAAATTAASASETIFAGEQVTTSGALITNLQNGVVAYGNSTSAPIDIRTTAFIENPTVGDQVLRITEGKKDYRVIKYYGTAGWRGMGFKAEEADYLIQPGEAFYFAHNASQSIVATEPAN